MNDLLESANDYRRQMFEEANEAADRERERIRDEAAEREINGPDYIEGRDVPCHECDASGVEEDGEQIDVDAFLDRTCVHCGGSGKEPWRPAGFRDTSAPDFGGHIFNSLRHARTRVIKAKTGYVMGGTLSQHRAAHANYVRSAGRQTLGFVQLLMVESAIRTDVVQREALEAWRAVA